ncbi:hypothetical protein BOTCAL_0034g00160 [Botryotinia calthae]|uniref:Uncharacterized protein n=1 Tax=Botryotinia calthae TaxID=38488 RepID=A0A4Y8DFI5_9HELO|nr:hypothetical protein BOTCAL_0034g00160 [Botryotinia calthae]
MSLGNTDSHNNNMVPLENETVDEEVQFKYSSMAFIDPNWQTRWILSIFRNISIFGMTSTVRELKVSGHRSAVWTIEPITLSLTYGIADTAKLPLIRLFHEYIIPLETLKPFIVRELQLNISKYALPAPRVVRWSLRAASRSYWPTSGSHYPPFDEWKFLGLDSLLQTDSVSNAPVNLEYIKIKSEHGQGKAPPLNWRWKHYTSMRPNQDIILIHFLDLDRLYRNGGSINLEKFAHIAMYHRNDERWPEDFLVEVLDFIQAHCPSLQRLSLLICNQ